MTNVVDNTIIATDFQTGRQIARDEEGRYVTRQPSVSAEWKPVSVASIFIERNGDCRVSAIELA